MSRLVCLDHPVASRLTHLIAEFRRHRAVTEPVHIIGFLSQWKLYLDQLPGGDDVESFRGAKLDATVFEKVCAATSRSA
jgi:hypothetical protein